MAKTTITKLCILCFPICLGIVLLSDFWWGLQPYQNQIKTAICVLFVLLVWMGWKLCLVQRWPRLTYTDVFCLLFAAVFIIHLDGSNPVYACEVAVWLLWYLYARQLSLDESYLFYYLFVGVGIAQIILGADALNEPWHTRADIKGLFPNTSVFGGYMAVAAVILVNMWWHGDGFFKRRWVIVLNILLLLPLLYQLIVSNSRAGWLAFMVAVAYSAASLVKPVWTRLRVWAKSFVCVVVFILCGLLFFQLYLLKKGSADGRLLIWQVSLEMIADRPLSGYGPDGFYENYMARQAAFFKEHPDSPYAILAGENRYAFSEAINLAVKFGLLPLLIVCVVLYRIFKQKHYAGNVPGVMMKSILLSLLVFSCFSYPCRFLPFSLLLVFLVARLAASDEALRCIQRRISISLLVRRGLVLLYLSLSIPLAVPSANYWRALDIWHEAENRGKISMDSAVLESYAAVAPLLQRDDYFLLRYGKALSRYGEHRQAVQVLQQAYRVRPGYVACMELGSAYGEVQDTVRMIRCWEEASRMLPSRFFPLYKLMLFYKETNRERAKYYARILVNKREKIASPLSRRAQQEAMKLLNGK